ncbi:hypothetical protein FV219_01040 [Methylobacterium sp. WL122]|nr:hypothetical protein FV219_01040 [Methylobacterium sp. WL122]
MSAKNFENDRRKLEARLRAYDELRDDALTECDFLREENVRLVREAAEVLKLWSENERHTPIRSATGMGGEQSGCFRWRAVLKQT